jgi:hypothetical protein
MSSKVAQIPRRLTSVGVLLFLAGLVLLVGVR